MGCSPPGSSVLGTFQARILEWIAISSYRGSSQPRDRTRISWVSCIVGRLFTAEPLGSKGGPEAPNSLWIPAAFGCVTVQTGIVRTVNCPKIEPKLEKMRFWDLLDLRTLFWRVSHACFAPLRQRWDPRSEHTANPELLLRSEVVSPILDQRFFLYISKTPRLHPEREREREKFQEPFWRLKTLP